LLLFFFFHERKEIDWKNQRMDGRRNERIIGENERMKLCIDNLELLVAAKVFTVCWMFLWI